MKPIDMEIKKHELENKVNAAFSELKKFKAEHPEMKNGYYLNMPGSWLNAYRESDLSFEEVIALIELHNA